MSRMSIIERLEKHYIPEPMSGCWLWTGVIAGSGYGYLSKDGKPHRAHRIAYQIYKGKIPAGLDLDHLCRVRSCVNPDHLEPVTRSENMKRGVGYGACNSRKTHCIRGHPYTDDNLYLHGGRRHCRTCRSIDGRQRYLRGKQCRK